MNQVHQFICYLLRLTPLIASELRSINVTKALVQNRMPCRYRIGSMFVIFVLESVNEFNWTKQPTEIVLLPVVMISVFDASGMGFVYVQDEPHALVSPDFIVDLKIISTRLSRRVDGRKYTRIWFIIINRYHHLLLSLLKRYPKVIFHLSIDGYLIINLKVKQFLFCSRTQEKLSFYLNYIISIFFVNNTQAWQRRFRKHPKDNRCHVRRQEV